MNEVELADNYIEEAKSDVEAWRRYPEQEHTNALLRSAASNLERAAAILRELLREDHW